MSKTALIFAGQGAQAVGMGKDLAEAFPTARALFDQANAAEKRAVKAETRAEYLEELLRKHLGLTPNLESLK